MAAIPFPDLRSATITKAPDTKFLNKRFCENEEEDIEASPRVLPERHLLSVETSIILNLAVRAEGETGRNLREDEVVVLLVVSILPQVQSDQTRVRNDLLGFAKESISQSWQGFIFQSEINHKLKHFDLTTGGTVEGAMLQNQFLLSQIIQFFI